jgi:hypothetical protein
MNITIESKHKLSKVVWEFQIIQFSCVLRRVTEYSRPSRRHNYKTDRQWKAMGGLKNTMGEPTSIPQQVQDKLRSEMLKQFSIYTSTEWNTQ